MQHVFNDLYIKSTDINHKFTNLMNLVVCPENILLAYRNLKNLMWRSTVGYDKKTIEDLHNYTIDEIVTIVYDRLIPKQKYEQNVTIIKDVNHSNQLNRSIGISCIWDRLIQQCIKQIIEPICEAKFSNNSYGFRPNRCAEHAIAAVYNKLQLSHTHYVLNINIENFYKRVNHSKLMHQLWTIGIQDKRLLYIIRQILCSKVIEYDSKIQYYPKQGILQTGALCELFCNVVLNELDQWIDNQWMNHPMVYTYKINQCKSGNIIRSNAYVGMRKHTKLKEMYIVRYGEYIKIFCRDKVSAEKTTFAINQWVRERLKLSITSVNCITNCKHSYFTLLGFKIKVHKKGNKYTVISHIEDQALVNIYNSLKYQVKNIQRPKSHKSISDEIRIYNSMINKIHNYYNIATHVIQDCERLKFHIEKVIYNRITKNGRNNKLCAIELSDIGYVQHKNPKNKTYRIIPYVDNTNIVYDKRVLHDIICKYSYDKNILFIDNKIRLYISQNGCCAITGVRFYNSNEIHCHHIIPKSVGGLNDLSNLILIHRDVHRLIHCTSNNTIKRYIDKLKLNDTQVKMIQDLRTFINNN